MKEQVNKSRLGSVQVSSKRPYQAPVFSQFGLVSELTNSTAGSCQADNGAPSCPHRNNMYTT